MMSDRFCTPLIDPKSSGNGPTSIELFPTSGGPAVSLSMKGGLGEEVLCALYGNSLFFQIRYENLFRPQDIALTDGDVVQIALDEHWWRIEAWRRLDPRITYEDISMRQRPKDGVRSAESQRAEHNRLYVRVRSNREAFSILNWYPKPNTGLEYTDRIRARFSPQQLRDNSSRGVTPGLINLEKGEVPGNRVPIPRIRDMLGASTAVHGVKRRLGWHSPPRPATPQRPPKRAQKTPRRSARLQATPNQSLSSPVAAFKGLSIQSTEKSPLRVIKSIKDKPSENNVPRRSPRHDLREAKDNDGAISISSSESDLDSREISEFDKSVVVQPPSSSKGDVSSRHRELSESELDWEYEDYAMPGRSRVSTALEIEDSEPESPGRVGSEVGKDRLHSRKTTPRRPIDIHNELMDIEASRLEVLSRFMSYEPDTSEQDHTAEVNIPIAKTPHVDRHLEDSNVEPRNNQEQDTVDEANHFLTNTLQVEPRRQDSKVPPSSIPDAQTAATDEPIPDAPTSEQSSENKARTGLLESLVKELSHLRNAVADLSPPEPQSTDLIANKIDRLARISLDMQTGAAMLVDEISALREEVHRLGR